MQNGLMDLLQHLEYGLIAPVLSGALPRSSGYLKVRHSSSSGLRDQNLLARCQGLLENPAATLNPKPLTPCTRNYALEDVSERPLARRRSEVGLQSCRASVGQIWECPTTSSFYNLSPQGSMYPITGDLGFGY